jgi:muconolactone delta-isomerase
MFVHATGTIPDPDKLGPHLEEETRVVATLHSEGLLHNVFRVVEHPGVYMIIEADDVEDARKQLGRLPFVQNGLLLLEFQEVEKLL